MPRKPRRKPPTVPLYVRIPADLRARLDAASGKPPDEPWGRPVLLQDLVIRALYAAYPTPAPNEAADVAAAASVMARAAETSRQHKTAPDADPRQHKKR